MELPPGSPQLDVPAARCTVGACVYVIILLARSIFSQLLVFLLAWPTLCCSQTPGTPLPMSPSSDRTAASCVSQTFMWGDSEVFFQAPPECVSLAFNGLREGGVALLVHFNHHREVVLHHQLLNSLGRRIRPPLTKQSKIIPSTLRLCRTKILR